MKRILHITSQYPGKTGSGVYLNELIKEGNKKNYVQGLIAGLSKGEENIELNIPKKYFYPVLFKTEKMPFPIVGMSDIMPYESTKYSEMNNEMFDKWEKSFKKAIEKGIKEFKPDIIISHHLWVLTSLVKKMMPDMKVIGVCHGTDIRQFKKCPQYREYVLKGCRLIDWVLALNDEQKKIIHNIYSIPRKKIITIGGGYNKDIFYPSRIVPFQKDDCIKLIYAGKLSFSKGVLSLIKAYNMLEINKDEIELSIVGSGAGEEKREIEEVGNKSKLKVKFLGEVAQKELGEIFRQSHIFILPSFYEGLSLVTIEALASGLMAVVTALPGLKSFLGDEINNSGIIEYVDLPKMNDIDIPLEGELFSYEERLKNAIEKQINRLKEGYVIYEDVQNKIERLSWENIYNRIEKYF